MPKPTRSSRLTAEEKRLLQQEEEIRRRTEELNMRLKTLPAEIRETRDRERKLKELRARTSAPAISLGSARRPGAHSERRPVRTPARERQNARLKAIVLCLILLSLLLLLWRSLPG